MSTIYSLHTTQEDRDLSRAAAEHYHQLQAVRDGAAHPAPSSRRFARVRAALGVSRSRRAL